MNDLVKLDAVAELASRYKMDAEAFVNTVRSVAMPSNITMGQMIACLAVAREHGLNPLTKEIYFMPTKGGPIQPVVSVDGWIRKINEHPQFDGIEFESAGEGDSLEMTCRIYRKDRTRPIVVTEYLAECKLAGPVWKTHPRRMLRNRTLCQCARIAFGFAGIMEPEEFQQWQATPEIAGGELVVEEASARDGGEITFKGEARKRPSSSAFKEIGGQDKFNRLTADIEGCTTADQLQACFDAFARDEVPWYEFPVGWARLLQETYHFKLEDLRKAETPADDGAFLRAINEAPSREALTQLWQEASDADREAHEAAFLDRLDGMEAAA